jgi:hypothetical protein
MMGHKWPTLPSPTVKQLNHLKYVEYESYHCLYEKPGTARHEAYQDWIYECQRKGYVGHSREDECVYTTDEVPAPFGGMQMRYTTVGFAYPNTTTLERMGANPPEEEVPVEAEG